MILACLFDVDGVLIDTSRPLRDALSKTCEALGVIVTNQAVAQCSGSSPRSALRRLGVEDINAGLGLYRSAFRQSLSHTPADQNIISMLCNLKGNGMFLGVVTSRNKSDTSMLLKAAGVDSATFHTLVTYGDVTRPKPHPQGILLAADRLQVHPQDCAYVGDTLDDIVAAQGAGAVAIAALWMRPANQTQLKKMASHVVQKPSDLHALIASLNN